MKQATQEKKANMPGIESIVEILKKFSTGTQLTPEEEQLLGFPAELKGKSFTQLQEMQQKAKASQSGTVSFFNSPGHQLIASNITMTDANGITFSSSDQEFTIGSGTVSYADIVALAGDFFAGTTLSTITESIGQTEASGQQALFADKFQSLLDQSGGPLRSSTPVADLLSDFTQQTNVVKAAQAKYGPSSSWLGYKEPIPVTVPNFVMPGYPDLEITTLSMEDYFDYLIFTQAIGVWYWIIASYNFDHFGNNAVTAYNVGHVAACATAGAAQTSGDPQSALLKAYMMNAYADHFMTDLFAPGHLRVPRVALHDVAPYFGDRLAQMMHGEDNIMGLTLTRNLDGETWTGFGDTRAYDAVNADNIKRANEAVGYSIAEVYNAFVNQDTSTPANKALQYAPDPTLVLANTSNHPPMFKMNGSQLQYRDPVDIPNFGLYEDLNAFSAASIYFEYEADPPYEFVWNQGTSIPNSSCKEGGVALTVFNDTLYAAWVDHNQDDEKFQIASSADGVTWTTLPDPMANGANGGNNGNAPALMAFNGQLYLAWSGYDNNGIYLSTSSDPANTNSWSNQVMINGSSSTKYGAPTLAVFNNQLYVAWCSHDEDPSGSRDTMVYCNWMTESGIWQPSFQQVFGPGTYENSPSLCPYNDQLWAAWFGYDYNGVYHNTSNGSSWSPGQSAIGGTTETDTKYGGPCLTTYGGELYAFWLEDDDNPSYSRYAITEGDDGSDNNETNGSWIPPQNLNNMDIDELPLAACEFGEYLAVAWIDDDSDTVMVRLATPTAEPNLVL